MGTLGLYKNSLQSFCNILRSILKTEIMVIDKDLIAQAGTGPYKRNVGTRRPRDSYVHMSIMSGRSYKIESPKETAQCMKCEMRFSCPYTSVISTPLKYQDEVVGLFGFLGYNSDQRRIMLNNSLSLATLSDNIANFLVDIFFQKAFPYKNLFGSKEISQLINSIEEGIILTDRDNRIINMNEFAETLLKLKKEEFLHRDLSLLQGELEINGSGFGGAIQRNYKKRRTRVLAKPINPDCPMTGHVIVIHRGSKKKNIKKRTYNYADPGPPQEFIGQSEAILQLKNIVTKIAKNTSTTLITGETGTGKELVARLIHYESPRRHNPFITVNCSAIPDSLFESELFGYAEGAFTGAKKNGKIGKFEMANGGTLFLDEIGYLSLDGQSKILRFMEDNILEKVGASIPKKVDIRIIAATNKDLRKMVQEKSFLEDLYYRLNVIPLYIPPLRERIEDIPLLLNYFLRKTNQRFGHAVLGFDSDTLSFLITYKWPGNVRELRNIVEYVCNIKDKGLAKLDDLPPYLIKKNYKTQQAQKTIAQVERLLINEAIRIFGNSTKGKKEAAKYLGISLTTLYRRLANQSHI